jgi:hypothetical protein
MRNILNDCTFACLLCVTLLFTMGIGVKPGTHKQTETAVRALMEYGPPLVMTNTDLWSIETPAESAEPAEAAVAYALPAVLEAEEASYAVTAYMLNVRYEADAASKIVNVVTKGTVLEVTRTTDNGWLELKNGGFVHGSYTEAIKNVSKPAVYVEAAAVEAGVLEGETLQAAPLAKAVEPVEPVQHVELKKPSSTVASHSGLTEEHISKVLKNTAFEGEGLEKAIVELEHTFGINSYFTIAVMKLESGHGKSQLAQRKNNLFGLNASGKDAYTNALSFSSKGESVKEFGQIISSYYIDKGLTSVDKIAGKYCAANSNWPSLVKSIMNSDYKKLL